MEKLLNCFKLEDACMLIGVLDFIIYLSLTLVSAFFFGIDILDMKKIKYFAYQDIYDGLSRFGVDGEVLRANAKVDDLTIITGDPNPSIMLPAGSFYNFNAIIIFRRFRNFPIYFGVLLRSLLFVHARARL